MIGKFPAVLMNFNRWLFLQLNRFICNKLPVLPDHIPSLFLHPHQGYKFANLPPMFGEVFGITSRYPGVFESNRLHVDIFRFFFNDLGYIL